MKILVLGHDKPLSDSLVMILRYRDFAAEAIELEDASFVESYEADVIVIGEQMGSSSIDSFLKKLRKRKENHAVIALCDSGLDGRVAALCAGADDCLDLPFHIDELIARIRAVARRRQGRTSDIVEVGDLKIDTDKREVFVADQRTLLTSQEFNVLAALARQPGRTYSKPALVAAICTDIDHEPEPKIIDVLVFRMRRKFDPDKTGRDYIANVWGEGYQLVDHDGRRQVRKVGK